MLFSKMFNKTLLKFNWFNFVRLNGVNCGARSSIISRKCHQIINSDNNRNIIKFNIENVKFNLDTNYLTIKDDQNLLNYPIIWLRDNCQCPKCYHTDSNSRTVDWQDFDINVKITKFWYDKITDELKIIWNDQHETIHKFYWLLQHRFTEDNRTDYLEKIYRPKKTLWSATDFQDVLQTFEFQDILNTDEGLKNWLESLTANGVAMIKNAPLTELECRKIANRVGFIRKTHYGEEFIVRAKENTNNVAYLSSKLQLHTDLPYYEYKPGVNLLHCIVQSKSSGGFNQLADGFYVAEKIRQNYSKEFKHLTEILVNWNDIGHENQDHFHSIYRAPVICLDRDGNYERINYSNPQRDSHFSVPLEMVNDWYKAWAVFTKLIYEEAVSFKTQPGEILTFDNIRTIHGRTEYSDNQNNTRYIVGAYLDWDEIFSRLRVLKL